MSERHDDLSIIAGHASVDGGAALGANSRVLLGRIDESSEAYVVIEVTDLAGDVLASSKPDVSIDPSDEEWFRAAAAGQTVVETPAERDGRIDWVIAQPIVDSDGTIVGVVVGYLRTTVLVELLDPELNDGTEVLAVDSDHRLVYETTMGSVADDAALLAGGALSTIIDNDAVTRGLVGEQGSVAYTDDAWPRRDRWIRRRRRGQLGAHRQGTQGHDARPGDSTSASVRSR